MSTFWTKACHLMEEGKIRQVDLARAVGCPKGTVFAWIKRDTLPQADYALKIADMLGVSVRYLVTGEDEGELSPREKELLRVCSILSQDKFEAVMKVATVMRDTTMRELSGASSSGVSEHKAE